MSKRFAFLGVAVLALALPALDAQAQTGTARGRVMDEQGQAIPDAKVEISYLGGVTRKFETKTNKKGEYTQVGIQPGEYRVTVSKEGFQGGYIELKVSLGDATIVPDFKLKSAAAAQKAAGGGAAELQAAFNKGAEAMRAGKLDEAEALFKELATKSPSVPEIHLNLGYLYRQKKDWASAEAAYKKALELRPDYSEAVSGLVRAYQDSGQKDKAVELLNQASSSGDAKVVFEKGIFHLNASQHEEAYEAFKRSQELDPENAEVYYYLGTVALNLGKADETIASLEKYLSLNPTNAQNKATAEGLLVALKPKK